MQINVHKIYSFIGICLFLAATAVSLVLASPLPLIAVAFPLCILERAYILPLLITVECIKGAVTEDDGLSIAEVLAVSLSFILVGFDLLIKNKRRVPFKLTMLLVFFGILVVLGFYVWLLHPQISETIAKSVGSAIFTVCSKIFLLLFMFVLLKGLINYDREIFKDMLEFLNTLSPYIIFLVFGYLVVKGHVTGTIAVDHFGDEHHGEYSADLCTVGAFMVLTLFRKKDNIFKKFIAVLGLAALLVVIGKLASRNGVICYGLMGIFGGYLMMQRLTTVQKIALIMGTLATLVIVGYAIRNTAAIQRFIEESSAQGVDDRWDYWASGIKAFEKEPIFGLGGDESASLYAVALYSPGILPHVMHDTFLEMAVEYGSIGFIFYLVLFFTVVRCAWKNFKYAWRNSEFLLAIPSMGYVISLTAGLFISRVWMLTPWYWLILTWAVYILWVHPAEEEEKRQRILPRYSRQRPRPLEPVAV